MSRTVGKPRLLTRERPRRPLPAAAAPAAAAAATDAAAPDATAPAYPPGWRRLGASLVVVVVVVDVAVVVGVEIREGPPCPPRGDRQELCRADAENNNNATHGERPGGGGREADRSTKRQRER